jgi:glutamine---fructose-6-phosphate transaminase (isomerizing)
MCGIFGILFTKDERLERESSRALVLSLLTLSETRGREAAGLAVHDGQRIEVLKQSGSVSSFLTSKRLNGVLDRAFDHFQAAPNGNGDAGRWLAITGHTRLVTNGFQSNDDNNQPVITGGAVALHNGIIVNDRALAARHPELTIKSEVDTEVLAALLSSKLASQDLVAATRATFAEIEGSASISMLFGGLDCMLLATNTGSLFRLRNERNTVFVFASERFILQRVLEQTDVMAAFGSCRIEQIKAGEAQILRFRDLEPHSFTLAPEASPASMNGFVPPHERVEIVDHSSRPDRLGRCTRCILPETYPFMDFDQDGVCSYCRTWKKVEELGEEALFRAVEPYRSKDGSPDVIVAFSGGRDSSYGLHYVKKTLGMNPVAFTYDWGMVTDLARRNQARVCGKLGVEHILRSADITAKRRYIRKNVEAWLKRPELGMVTLFMAGDKEFYSYARQLRKETGIKLVIFCTGNMIEDAPYKTGLMGVPQDDHGNVLTGMSLRNKVGMLRYFATQYAKNPAYINESLYDTLNAYYQTFVVKDDFLYLFRYLPWHEDVVVGTIRREYDWEIETDTTTTWRIGDGSAAFYNYIYQTIAGFTEDDVMLSNMIREGHVDRAAALRRSEEYARPRWRSIREYAQLVGFSAEEALQVINSAPKLY